MILSLLPLWIDLGLPCWEGSQSEEPRATRLGIRAEEGAKQQAFLSSQQLTLTVDTTHESATLHISVAKCVNRLDHTRSRWTKPHRLLARLMQERDSTTRYAAPGSRVTICTVLLLHQELYGIYSCIKCLLWDACRDPFVGSEPFRTHLGPRERGGHIQPTESTDGRKYCGAPMKQDRMLEEPSVVQCTNLRISAFDTAAWPSKSREIPE